MGFDFAVASAAIEWRIGGMLKKLKCRVTAPRVPDRTTVSSLLQQPHHADVLIALCAGRHLNLICELTFHRPAYLCSTTSIHSSWLFFLLLIDSLLSCSQEHIQRDDCHGHNKWRLLMTPTTLIEFHCSNAQCLLPIASRASTFDRPTTTYLTEDSLLPIDSLR